jgi:hypothetical protein
VLLEGRNQLDDVKKIAVIRSHRRTIREGLPVGLYLLIIYQETKEERIWGTSKGARGER